MVLNGEGLEETNDNDWNCFLNNVATYTHNDDVEVGMRILRRWVVNRRTAHILQLQRDLIFVTECPIE